METVHLAFQAGENDILEVHMVACIAIQNSSCCPKWEWECCLHEGHPRQEVADEVGLNQTSDIRHADFLCQFVVGTNQPHFLTPIHSRLFLQSLFPCPVSLFFFFLILFDISWSKSTNNVLKISVFSPHPAVLSRW